MTAPVLWTPPKLIPHHHKGSCACEPTIAYIRVSRVGARDTIISPDIQLTEILNYCARKNLRVVLILCDINKSGTTFRKRSVDRAIAFIREGGAKSITLWKWSRWGRNHKECLIYLAKAKNAGGRVYSATEDMDTETAFGEFSQTMIMGYDQFTSRMIGEGWRATHNHRLSNGLPHSGRARFGYVYLSYKDLKAGLTHENSESCAKCKEPEAHYVTHPVEGERLVDLYESYVAGTSLRQLARDLNAEGFKTPLNGRWTQQAVGTMLDTGFAAGYIRGRSPELRAKLTTEDKQWIRNCLANFDVWEAGAQPRLIEPQLWKKYLKRRGEQRELAPRNRAGAHPLSSLMFCALCSRRMITKYTGRARRHSWHCEFRSAYHPDVNVSVVNAAVMEIVRSWLLERADPVRWAETVNRVALAEMERKKAASRPRGEIESELAAERKALSRLRMQEARDGDDEGFDRDAFVMAKDEFEANIARLVQELSEVEDQAEAPSVPPFEAFQSLDAVWDEALRGDRRLLNEPLKSVIGYVIVSPSLGRGRWGAHPSERVEVVGRWEMESKESWLAERRLRLAA